MIEAVSRKSEDGSRAILWIGLLDLEILPGCTAFDDDNDVKGAFVYFVAMARSADEFRTVATEISELVNFRVRDMDEVSPWEIWRKTATDVDDYLHERAVDTVQDGDPRFGTFHRYLAD